MEILEPENSIIILNTSIPLAADPAVVFEQGIETVVASIAEVARAHTFDVTTKAGYDGIVSLAARIRSSKAKLDKIGKDLTEDWRERTKAINGKRNYVVAELDALAAEIRKPVTDMEEAEKARKAKIEAYITGLTDFVTALEQHRVCLEVITSERAKFATRYENAGEYQSKLDALYARIDPAADAAIAELDRKAAEKAELERLRKEAAEREIQDRIEAAAAKAREEAKAEAEQKAEAERVKQEAALAAEKAARERAEAEAIAAKENERRLAEQAKYEQSVAQPVIEPTLFEVAPVVQDDMGIAEVWGQGVVDLMDNFGLDQDFACRIYHAIKEGKITGLVAV